jgi:FkbM family methyltransferase
LDLLSDLSRLAPLSGFKEVLDVGANKGQTAITFTRGFPSARIHSFEPFPRTFSELEANTRAINRVKRVPLACGSSIGVVEVPVQPAERSGLNSLVAGNHVPREGVRFGARESIQVTTIDAYCAQEGINRIDLLKIDTEGFEVEVLKGAPVKLGAGLIDFVYAECDFGQVDPNEIHGSFFELHELLSRNGFRLVTIYTDFADRRGFHWGNALFARQGA